MGNKRPNSGEAEGADDTKKTRANSQISVDFSTNTMDQNGTGAQQPQARTTCVAPTCMFFGSPATEGYCSVCYKAELGKREEEARKAVQGASNNNNNTSSQTKSSETSAMPIQVNSGTRPVQISSPNSSIAFPPSSSSPSSTSAMISASAPVPVVPTPQQHNNSSSSPSSSLQQPSTSSKRRNDDSICSVASELGLPSDKKSNSDSPSKPKKRKCGVCKKKIGLTGFKCRCGGMFCPLHRYEDQHNCQFDYATSGREQLRKDNPVVQDDKIVKF